MVAILKPVEHMLRKSGPLMVTDCGCPMLLLLARSSPFLIAIIGDAVGAATPWRLLKSLLPMLKGANPAQKLGLHDRPLGSGTVPLSPPPCPLGLRKIFHKLCRISNSLSDTILSVSHVIHSLCDNIHILADVIHNLRRRTLIREPDSCFDFTEQSLRVVIPAFRTTSDVTITLPDLHNSRTFPDQVLCFDLVYRCYQSGSEKASQGTVIMVDIFGR
jgi:hypothetical protein